MHNVCFRPGIASAELLLPGDSCGVLVHILRARSRRITTYQHAAAALHTRLAAGDMDQGRWAWEHRVAVAQDGGSQAALEDGDVRHAGGQVTRAGLLRGRGKNVAEMQCRACERGPGSELAVVMGSITAAFRRRAETQSRRCGVAHNCAARCGVRLALIVPASRDRVVQRRVDKRGRRQIPAGRTQHTSDGAT